MAVIQRLSREYLFWLRVQLHPDSRGSNAVHDHLKSARAGLAAARDVEHRIGGARGPHAHGREIVAPRKADIARGAVGKAHKREVGGRLRVIAIDAAEIEAVEVCPRDGIS